MGEYEKIMEAIDNAEETLENAVSMEDVMELDGDL